MSDLIVLTYADQFRATEVMATLGRLQVEHLIDLEDACVVTKDKNGVVKLHQSVNMTSEGAWEGGFWGALVGLLFFNPLLGAALGAGIGAVGGAGTDYGISDDFIKSLAVQMSNDSSGIFILVQKVTPDKVLAELSKFGGTILRTSLPSDVEAKWQRALNGETPDLNTTS